jgi:HAD superfamily hydrolase (TIGR01549 family)
MRHYRGFIFDLDGTLVDSALDFAAIRRDIGLADNSPILESIAGFTPGDRAEAFRIIDRHEEAGAHASILIPGVAEFLAKLKKENKLTAIFTRNSKKVTAMTLIKHGLDFSVVMTRDDAPAKPDPTALHLIGKKWNCLNSELLFVGDYLYDLRAGLAAQVPTALYLSTPADFDTQGAVFCFNSFLELEASFG